MNLHLKAPELKSRAYRLTRCLLPFQVAVERTKPTGRILGIDIIPAQPPKGASTIQGNFLSREVQAEIKRFLADPNRGRPRPALVLTAEQQDGAATDVLHDRESYIDMERRQDTVEDVAGSPAGARSKRAKENEGKMVDVVLSDMCEPWLQTDGFWKRSLSDPYIRMMNTSGINFKDHAGSMVRSSPSLQSRTVDRFV